MASPENPPFEGIEYNPDKVTMANSTAYKMEKQFIKLGLFGARGAITPLGTKVERLRSYVIQQDGVGHDDLVERFDSETIQAALKSGQIRKERKLLYF